ncbi:hypothetical protein NIES30_24475 [Phormidium tenue NIES-30]|uniref:Uncharacterized protein n=1 Tax=Phormidium tenue NIES-30 TaxID=549789 RepID=A0A1U7IYD8_9CYAN|nr:hypothetical protein NIES30_24475 [Phormidium tenue NIES-30]
MTLPRKTSQGIAQPSSPAASPRAEKHQPLSLTKQTVPSPQYLLPANLLGEADRAQAIPELMNLSQVELGPQVEGNPRKSMAAAAIPRTGRVLSSVPLDLRTDW